VWAASKGFKLQVSSFKPQASSQLPQLELVACGSKQETQMSSTTDYDVIIVGTGAGRAGMELQAPGNKPWGLLAACSLPLELVACSLQLAAFVS
jgi:hypothetical protein